MSKLISVLIIILLLCSDASAFMMLGAKRRNGGITGTPRSTGSNVLLNSGFESGDFTSWTGFGGGTKTIDNTTYQEGSYSFKIVTSGFTSGGTNQTITVDESSTYKLDGYIYVSSHTSGAVHIDAYSGDCGIDSSGINVMAANGGFAYKSENINIPAGCTSITVRALFDDPSDATLTAYFDNIQLRKYE